MHGISFVITFKIVIVSLYGFAIASNPNIVKNVMKFYPKSFRPKESFVKSIPVFLHKSAPRVTELHKSTL
jgi:hypothetical protein